MQILQRLNQEIFIPPAVFSELCTGTGRPGSKMLDDAITQGWLQLRKLSASSALSKLSLILDHGEAEAIVLAEEVNCRFLLIDERKGIPVAGIAGVLLAVKENGLVDEIMPIVKKLEECGYRLSSVLVKEIARLSGENTG